MFPCVDPVPHPECPVEVAFPPMTVLFWRLMLPTEVRLPFTEQLLEPENVPVSSTLPCTAKPLPHTTLPLTYRLASFPVCPSRVPLLDPVMVALENRAWSNTGPVSVTLTFTSASMYWATGPSEPVETICAAARVPPVCTEVQLSAASVGG